MLAKGLNYNTTDAKKLDFIADLESALKNTELTEETKNNIRHQVTTNLLHLNHPIDLTKQEREALEDLKKDDDIVILPADKGRMTVVMDKSDYTNKAKTLINDTNTYQPLDTDPSKTSVNRINKKLKSLKDQDKLNKRTYDQIRPKDATIAKFYGLPKIHKDNNPLRPIVSLPGSPTYNLSKYLADILKPLVSTSPHSVKNVNAFLSKIKDIHVEPDEIMISFDVVSLFTSIPLDTARLITEKLLTNNTSWQTKTELNIQDILVLLDLCLSTEFCFQNNYYRQISGIPMGSPLSSFLAEAVMQDLESKAVTNNDDIKTWDRYVDDVLATVKKDKTDDILLTINNTTKNIKFTNEEEHDNKLAFLDVLITKTDNGTLTTQVSYRKKTHTDQILNYNSNHPTQHNTTQHNTTQHNTTQHNTTQHNTTQHNTTQHNTTQHNTTQSQLHKDIIQQN